MALHFKNIALYVKKNNINIKEPLLELLQVLRENQCNIVLDDVCKELAAEYDCPDIEDNKIDLTLSLGGDGSLLQIARKTFKQGIPLLGINVGKLGFLADISTQQLQTLVEILHGEYCIDERQVLEVSLLRDQVVIEELNAINEVVLFNGNIARLMDFKVFVDEHFVISPRADGIIVATTTGSTAYALSAGGPILCPGSRNLVMVPICAHSLSARPIVINDTSHICIQTSSKQHIMYKISCDGQVHIDVQPQDEIKISKAAHTLKLLHPKNYNYYDLLRGKLGWYHETIKPH